LSILYTLGAPPPPHPLASHAAEGGIGRAVFESTNKAILADVFPLHKDAAFAAATAASGGSAAVAFFLFPHIDKAAMVVVTAASAVVALAALVPVRHLK
jgi:hypothetical protein